MSADSNPIKERRHQRRDHLLASNLDANQRLAWTDAGRRPPQEKQTVEARAVVSHKRFSNTVNKVLPNQPTFDIVQRTTQTPTFRRSRTVPRRSRRPLLQRPQTSTSFQMGNIELRPLDKRTFLFTVPVVGTGPTWWRGENLTTTTGQLYHVFEP
ncbi:hypothetical protein BC827DRAFT_687685 [Russula dissimulans]|nr:hypothetical protein BC827DRAFT_687685 [Russula dissimulans]